MNNKIHTVILKCTNRCNMACQYCYAGCNDMNCIQNLDKDIICDLFKEIMDSELSGSKLQLIWHGGEPTLYSVSDADFVMDYILQSAHRKNINIRFSLQSNGYFIPLGWMNLITKYNIGVGISIDGPQEINDTYRKDVTGKGTYNRVLDNITYLKENYAPVSLLSVIDRRHYGKANILFNWTRKMSMPIKFNPAFCLKNPTEDNWENYFTFLREIMALYVQSDENLSISPIDWILNSMLHECPPTDCAHSGHCGTNIICIDPFGNISPCGRFADNPQFVIPYINGNLLGIIQQHKNAIELLHNKRRQELNCQQCNCYKLCYGGCSAISYNTDMSKHCRYFSEFLEYISTTGLNLLQFRLNEERIKILDNICCMKNRLRGLKNG